MKKFSVKCKNPVTGAFFVSQTNDPDQRMKRIKYDCNRVNGNTNSTDMPYPRNFIFQNLNSEKIAFSITFNQI
jgi:hypothetical protein